MSSRFNLHFIPIWKEAPFLRFLVPFAAGIIFQWYVNLPVFFIGLACCSILPVLAFFYYSKYRTTYKLGIVLNILLFIAGCWLVILKDGSRRHDHISKHYYGGEAIIATLQEPLVAKLRSYKAIASVQLLDSLGNAKTVSGNIILYLAKDSIAPLPEYGSQLIFKRPLVPIKNAGNPGGFNYKRYAAFNGWYYQVYLKRSDYVITGTKTYNRFRRLLYSTRDFVINVFRKNIPGHTEAGLAEALLVGYKEDLDKSLVEQYANTGVVHIIAISGMHLGLIYGLLLIVLKPFQRKKYGKIISALLIIAAIWFFSLLTGAAPSITRSAIMFTVIVAGQSFNGKAGMYNSLAASAFMLLLINPFNLWDVGFQLSYAALLSIAVLGNPIANAIHPANFLLRKIWQLIAVTLAAQVFTMPFVLFHFHQFPLSFLLANLLAVTVSSLILYGLLTLLVVSFIPVVSAFVGSCCFYLIKFMNGYVAFIDSLPFSKIEAINYTIVQALLLMLIISALVWWWLKANAAALIANLTFILLFTLSKQVQYFQVATQRKLVVYNVPKLSAVDIIEGSHYSFIGDTVLQQKGSAQNFNLLPTRILYHVAFDSNMTLTDTAFTKLHLGKYSMLIADKPIDRKMISHDTTDYLLVNKNAAAKPGELLQYVHCKNIILDGTNSNRSISQWKNAATAYICASIPCRSRAHL